MNDQEWIGVQFNFDQPTKLKSSLQKYKNQGIATGMDHITFYFGKNELKKFDKDTSIKFKLLKTAIQQYLQMSSYTNIYTFINAESASKHKYALLDGEFRQSIRVSDIKDKASILKNYESKIESTQLRKILRKDRIMSVMDKIFNFIITREFELQQKLTLEISYEDKDEFGTDRDNLNVSIQLE